MYCAETSSAAEEGWEYFRHQMKAAQHHYFEWNNPGFQGIKGYEDYVQRPAADVGPADGDRADANVAARMAPSPLGPPTRSSTGSRPSSGQSAWRPS